MKAAQLTQYNKNNIKLELVDTPMPELGAQDVLVKVTAAGVNPVDNMISRGQIKLLIPYKLPQIAGNEVVGIVEKVGTQVTGFKVGDRVFARMPLDRIGAFAEYAAINYRALAHVPDYLTDVEAAAVPLTALTVMQALDLMGAKKGGTFFMTGGTGGVGAMAIPIAKAKGLTVITNGNIDNKARIMALGLNRFIDYKTEDYTQTLSQVDYVLDTLGGAETEKQMSIMKKGGKLVNLSGMPNKAFAKRFGLPKWKQILFGLVGGTGGVGAMAIPIAKAKGLTVITNGNIDNKARIMALGLNRFIDYKTEDYTQTLSQVDYVLDTLGGAETEKQMSIMKKGGKLVNLSGMPNKAFAKRFGLPKWKQILFGLVGGKFDRMAKKYGVTYDFVFVESNGAQLQEVADLFSQLKIKPSIDTVYDLSQINEALDKVANGRSRGKTVITFGEK